MRFARQRDANEPAIFDALVKVGCKVERGTDVDLYVEPRLPMRESLPMGEWWQWQGLLMEVKMPGEERSLTALQLRLKQIFGQQYVIVSSVSQALAAIGVNEGGGK